MWLIQDLANVFVYLPRRLPFWAIALSLAGMVAFLAILIRGRGGKIQQVVTEKTNTIDLRSATLIDLLYGVVLLFFKVDYIPVFFESLGWQVPWPPQMPMSTTWVFLGLLAGREIGMWLMVRQYDGKKLRTLILKDLAKVSAGTLVALVVAFVLPALAKMSGYAPEVDPSAQIERVSSEDAIAFSAVVDQ